MTQTHELDCSDAAKMLIERMQTHPEDFKYGGKLYRVLNGEQLSERDKKVYNDAHDKYIKEPALMASLLQALLVQPEENEVEMTTFKNQGRYATGMGVTGTGPRIINVGTGAMGAAIARGEGQSIWYDEATSTVKQRGITQEMFEDHIQTHKSPIKKHVEALAAEKKSIAAQMYDKAFNRERIERDN
ncbi:hypothetical protein UFOVP48_45 [uncultured Caudovirales phage]|uniref:Uncharacterized protein n=1 Tax=uncultured Caudovirales phage TaxID=2100421 RepID=A0A6J5KRF5_9CAUD|nr:hypothetical protein UFOVP48_45 [uncultured Caudovirales phage]